MPTGRRGFALTMVVLLLFAVAVAAATGYQIVSIENDLAIGGEDQEEALAVARAGLERYVGEHIGVPGASVTYAIGDGNVTVTQKRMFQTDPTDPPTVASIRDDTMQVWMIQSVGTVANSRYPNSPATRTVRQYARLHNRPVNPSAALIWNTSALRVRNNGKVIGLPNGVPSGYPDTSPSCSAGGSGTGGAEAVGFGSHTSGSTPSPTGVSMSASALNTAARVRWGVIKDPSFTIPFESDWSNPSNWATKFASIPADSFPVIRYPGNLTLTSAMSGRGALIVTGNLDITSSFTSFKWAGIILANAADDLGANVFFASNSTICGMLVIGLEGTTAGTRQIYNLAVQYQEYAMAKANRSLAYFELIDGTRWEF